MDSWTSREPIEKPKPIKAQAEEACENLRAAMREFEEVTGTRPPILHHAKFAADVLEAVALGKRSI